MNGYDKGLFQKRGGKNKKYYIELEKGISDENEE